jgi:hypothetical protein
MSNWWMYIEKICDHCGGAYVSISDDSKYCSHSCALSDRGCSDKTKAKLSRIATEQWQRDRKFLMNALASRNMINVSSNSKKLWQDPGFRQKIQSARKAAGYPDPNRPEQVLKRKLRAAVKNALQRTLRHLHLGKTSHTYTLMGYTGKELREHLEKLFLGGMSWDNYGKWEIDHILPIASFPTNADIGEINALSNLRPLWKVENRKKWKYVTHP